MSRHLQPLCNVKWSSTKTLMVLIQAKQSDTISSQPAGGVTSFQATWI